MGDELEQLAQRGRSARSDREEAARKAERRKKKPRRNRLLQRSVRPGWIMFPLSVLFTGATAGLMMSLERYVWLQIGSVLGVIALLMGMLRIVDNYGHRRLTEWLSDLPFDIESQQYERLLGTGHGLWTRVTVRISFEREMTESTKQTINDAVLGAISKSEVSFDGDQLLVQSHKLRTRTRTENGSTSNNSRVHGWCKKLISRALIVVHRSHPIARVEFHAF